MPVGNGGSGRLRRRPILCTFTIWAACRLLLRSPTGWDNGGGISHTSDGEMNALTWLAGWGTDDPHDQTWGTPEHDLVYFRFYRYVHRKSGVVKILEPIGEAAMASWCGRDMPLYEEQPALFEDMGAPAAESSEDRSQNTNCTLHRTIHVQPVSHGG